MCTGSSLPRFSLLTGFGPLGWGKVKVVPWLDGDQDFGGARTAGACENQFSKRVF